MNVCEFRPGMEKIEIAEMPNVILIGKAKRNSQIAGAPAFWGECYSKGIFEKLADLPRLIPNHLVGWSGDCVETEDNPDRDFTYMIGALVPMDTIIPDEFDYRVLRGTLVAKGILGMEMYEVIDRIRELGYEPSYGDNNGWNAELYIDGESDEDKWSWIVPIKKRFDD